jgi:hypothetical protein
MVEGAEADRAVDHQDQDQDNSSTDPANGGSCCLPSRADCARRRELGSLGTYGMLVLRVLMATGRAESAWYLPFVPA